MSTKVFQIDSDVFELRPYCFCEGAFELGGAGYVALGAFGVAEAPDGEPEGGFEFLWGLLGEEFEREWWAYVLEVCVWLGRHSGDVFGGRGRVLDCCVLRSS